jgi:DNA polymerase-3 subunit gamma/tau
MEHQALARKWRPRSFDQMVGQEHVLKALINALDQNRLHHAYLFTGTRGVGKTTVARILSKCLNCEAGVSSTPCNQCSTCNEIDEGRCIDLIEVDAASRTKVEDTRDLLENVQYAPTRARYKVYLIDEVHMLSTHSFNALLKTLEEPPPHVKFLLATTDPQKLPVTVLSRCLQFNLKNIASENIVGHLKHVLDQEEIKCDESALWQIGRAADGSMRDALSLVDQAIAYGQNSVFEQDVSAMLGTIDRGRIFNIVEALIQEDAAVLLSQVKELAEFSPDYSMVLEQLLSVLHHTAIAQVVPEAIDKNLEQSEQILSFAKQLTAEDLQLYYQIALTGREDLPLNPDQKAGLEMLLLRMLVFKPGSRSASAPGDARHNENITPEGAKKKLSSKAVTPAEMPRSSNNQSRSNHSKGESKSAHALALVKGSARAAPKLDLVVNNRVALDDAIDDASVVTSGLQPEDAIENKATPESPEGPGTIGRQNGATADTLHECQALSGTTGNSSPDKPNHVTEKATPDQISLSPDKPLSLTGNDDWVRLVQQVKLKGMSRNILMQCTFKSRDSQSVHLIISDQYIDLLNATHRQRIVTSLSETLGCSLDVIIEAGETSDETPALYQQRLTDDRLNEAKLALENDKNVQKLIEQFDAVLEIDSIVPLD